MIGTSSYEEWARRLRQWGKDPAGTRLEDLPAMSVDDYSLEAFDRLVERIVKANEDFVKAFQDRLNGVFATSDMTTLSRAFHDLKSFYALRFSLAQHRGLPAEIRTELEKQAIADLREFQASVEGAVASPGGSRCAVVGNSSDLLRVVRENPLTSLITTLGLD